MQSTRHTTTNPEALNRQDWEVREGDGWREVNRDDVSMEETCAAERLRQNRQKNEPAKNDPGQIAVVCGWELVQNDKRKHTYTGFPSVALPPWASDFVETEIGKPEHSDDILKREMERRRGGIERSVCGNPLETERPYTRPESYNTDIDYQRILTYLLSGELKRFAHCKTQIYQC